MCNIVHVVSTFGFVEVTVCLSAVKYSLYEIPSPDKNMFIN